MVSCVQQIALHPLADLHSADSLPTTELLQDGNVSVFAEPQSVLPLRERFAL